MARCAATASSAHHRATHAARAAKRMDTCVSKARCPDDQPEPGGSPSAKPASEFFNTHNHEAAAAGAHQLGVGLVAFASDGAGHHPPA